MTTQIKPSLSAPFFSPPSITPNAWIKSNIAHHSLQFNSLLCVYRRRFLRIKTNFISVESSEPSIVPGTSSIFIPEHWRKCFKWQWSRFYNVYVCVLPLRVYHFQRTVRHWHTAVLGSRTGGRHKSRSSGSGTEALLSHHHMDALYTLLHLICRTTLSHRKYFHCTDGETKSWRM